MPRPTILFLATLVSAHPALGQQPSAPADTSHPRYGHGGIALAMAVFGTGLAFAPPALLLFKPSADTSLGGVPYGELTVFATGGAFGDDQHTGATTTEELEARSGPLLVAASVGQFEVPQSGRVEAFHLGYLLHPYPTMAGGLTLGYRQGTGSYFASTLEVGLPLVFQNRRGGFRFEPTYAFSHRGVTWNYRLRMEMYVLPKPLYLGFDFQDRSLHKGSPHFGTIALLLGVRH